MRSIPTRLSGPILLEPEVHRDERGFFLETFRKTTLEEFGVTAEFVQDNHSRSGRGVVRGMHFQPGMAKLVRCGVGEVLDVVVDLRRGSPTFGSWESFHLDDALHRQLFCPDGFAHGFCVLSESADVLYRCTAFYDSAADQGIAYDDPVVGISWPDQLELKPSKRDAVAPALRDVEASLPFTYVASTT